MVIIISECRDRGYKGIATVKKQNTPITSSTVETALGNGRENIMRHTQSSDLTDTTISHQSSDTPARVAVCRTPCLTPR